MYLVNLIAVCALQKLLSGLHFAVHASYSRTSCGHADKHNKHNVKSAGPQLFDFTICPLSVSLHFAVC